MITQDIKVRRWNDVPIDKAHKMIAKPWSRRLYALETDFIEWPEDLKCQEGFNGAHMVGVVPSSYKSNTDAVRTCDPLCKRLKRVKMKPLLRAAAAYNVRHGGKKGTVDILSIAVPPKPEG